MQISALENIWTLFDAPLKTFIRSRVPDADTADDLMQEVYLKIHTHLHTVRDHQRLSAWIYQVARHVIYDYYRGRKTETPLGETMLDLFAQPEDVEDEIIVRLHQSVRAMVAALPVEYRDALILTEYHSLTQRELAEWLGLSLSGAKSRVQRGRKMLREMLLACCHFEFDRRGKIIDYYPHCGCCLEDGCAN